MQVLEGKARAVQLCGEDARSGCIDVCVDSDWAGWPRTRKSTNGGVMVPFGMWVRVWSSTQTVVAPKLWRGQVPRGSEGCVCGSRLAVDVQRPRDRVGCLRLDW